MAFHNPADVRERLVVMGGPGAGKTRGWLSIADFSQKTGSDAQFYVIDTDFVVEYMLEVGFPHLRNVTWAEVGDWDEYMQAVEMFQRKIKKGDWMVGDLFSNAWETVQEAYTERAYGTDMASHFIERKKVASKKSEEGFEGSADWGIIKPMYRQFVTRFFYRHPGHVYACTGARALQRDGKWKDTNENIAWFDHLGFRPEGEKRTAHHAHTVLMMKKRRYGDTTEYVWATGKDRERKDRADVSLGTEEQPGSFAKSYLMGVAGWRP